MTPLERQFALKKKGITQKAIAEKIGVGQMVVSDVITGQRISNKVMRAVAEAIREDHRLVFPEYYLRPPKRKTSKVSQAA